MTLHLNGIVHFDSHVAVAVGDFGTILRTTDAGETWTGQNSGKSSRLIAIARTDSTTAIVVGDTGVILRTTDGGRTWASQTSGTLLPLRGVSFYGRDMGTAVGGESSAGGPQPCVILQTTDGGLSWRGSTPNVSTILNGVCHTGPMTCTAVGMNDIILGTTDGGRTWVQRPIDAQASLYGVVFPDPQHGIAVGVCRGSRHYTASVILQTSDGGYTWKADVGPTGIQEPVGNNLSSVAFSSLSTGTAVGDNGRILRTTTGGATWIAVDPPGADTALPERTMLSQNYPNPFNPNSDIRYQISEFRMVRIAVYDILGREVAVLVNEKKDPGTHTVTWNAGGVASGVYFCRMTAGPFTQTRKMLVVR